MAKVKGLAFRSVLSALESIQGPAAVKATRELLPLETASRLESLTASTWYPLSDYVNLWAAIQQATGNNRDLPRLIGRRAVEQDLRLIHRLAFAALSVTTMMSISARLFSSYYDTGRCRAEAAGSQRVRVHFEGCTGFTEPMWLELRGGSECVVEQASKMRAASTLVSGGRNLDSECVIDVAWFA